MRYEIRAMSFSEIIDAGFQLLRNHFTLLIGLSLVLYTPVAGFNLSLATLAVSQDEGALEIGLVAAIAVLLLLSLLVVAPIVGAAATYAVGRLYLGEEVSFRSSLRAALALLAPLIGTALLAWLALLLTAFVATAGAAILVAVSTTDGGGAIYYIVRAVLILGAVLLVALPTAYLYLALLLLWQVMIFEQLFGLRALRRSMDLMDGHKLRGLGVLVVVGLLVGVLSGGLQLALGFLPILGAVGVPLAQAVGHAYTNAVWVVLYFDIRCRKDAFDLEHLAHLVQAEPPSAPSPTASPVR